MFLSFEILIYNWTKVKGTVSFLTLLLPRSDCQFSPLAATHFLINKLREFGVRSR